MSLQYIQKEQSLRRRLLKAGYKLHKSRVKRLNSDNLGGYMIVDIYKHAVAWGSVFELTLEDVEDFVLRCE